MNREVNFWSQLQRYQIRISEIRSSNDHLRALIYVNTAVEFAKAFEIEQFPVQPLPPELAHSDKDQVTQALFKLEVFMNALHARNIFEIDSNLRKEFVELDEDWKAKASTYVQHIRRAVSSAEIEEALRERIFGRLNDLQKEIDRNRAKLAAVTETWLSVTEAVGQGAKNLEPVLGMLERLAGSFSRLRRAESEDAARSLPPPEKLGLPDLTEDE